MITDTPRRTPLEIRREIAGSNHARLLRLLYQNGDLSRADLARAVGFTKATVSALVAEMISDGIIVETRQRAVDGPGRPAVDLNIDRERWCVIAVDLAPDDVMRAALIDLNGRVIARASVLADGVLGDAAVDKTIQVIDDLRARSELRILGIGICAPGIVDVDGRVLASHNLGWTNVPLQKIVEEHTELPTHVANDANAAALAERDLEGFTSNLMVVKVGRGVGGAIVADGSLLHGGNFAAGEIGHVAIGDGEGPLCVCGRRGCLEASLSLPRLLAHLKAATSDRERAEVLEAGGRRLGMALAPIVGTLALEVVAVSGLPVDLATPILAAARVAMEPRLTPELLTALDLRISGLGEDVTLQGAVILVLTGVLGIADAA